MPTSFGNGGGGDGILSTTVQGNAVIEFHEMKGSDKSRIMLGTCYARIVSANWAGWVGCTVYL